MGYSVLVLQRCVVKSLMLVWRRAMRREAARHRGMPCHDAGTPTRHAVGADGGAGLGAVSRPRGSRPICGCADRRGRGTGGTRCSSGGSPELSNVPPVRPAVEITYLLTLYIKDSHGRPTRPHTRPRPSSGGVSSRALFRPQATNVAYPHRPQ